MDPVVQSNRLVILSAAEADAFAKSAREVVQYVAENFATARVFCQPSNAVAMASLLSTVVPKIEKGLQAGQQTFEISDDVVISAARLSQCAVSITRHLDLISQFSVIGNTISVVGGLLLKMPALIYTGLALTVSAQLFGPSLRIPVLEK